MNSKELQELAHKLNVSTSEGIDTVRFEWRFNLLFNKTTLERIDSKTLESALIAQLEKEIKSWK